MEVHVPVGVRAMTRRQQRAGIALMAALCHMQRTMYIDQLVTDLCEWRLGGNN